ncbi:MAG: hypothetical protein EOO28_13435 [Comamonadaceae bacterium]|nr:MAG: hypothetical protein EOO28_13435 [Comamonadaceae bacterium]
MKLKIISVHGHGDYDKEFVKLQVQEDCEVGEFVLTDSTFTEDDKVSNKLRHTFWFPDMLVKKGSIVSVWTRTGTHSLYKTDDGKPLHRFYWGLKTPVWNDIGDCAVLMHVDMWQPFKSK